MFKFLAKPVAGKLFGGLSLLTLITSLLFGWLYKNEKQSNHQLHQKLTQSEQRFHDIHKTFETYKQSYQIDLSLRRQLQNEISQLKAQHDALAQQREQGFKQYYDEKLKDLAIGTGDAYERAKCDLGTFDDEFYDRLINGLQPTPVLPNGVHRP